MTATYARDGAIAIIEINNPPVNAASAALRAGLADAIGRFAGDDLARVAILQCAGRTWIAGADISEFGKPPQPPLLPDVIAQIEAMPKPVIAAMHGTALGGGLEVALGAHYRIAAAGAEMGLPEVTLGILPGAGGTQRLPRLVGLAPAVDLITSARRIGAEEALKIGLIDRIAEGDLNEAAREYAQSLVDAQAGPRPCAAMAPPQIDEDLVAGLRARLAKRYPGQIAQLRAVDSVVEGGLLPLPEGLAQEREKFTELMDSPQRSALIHAFLSERAVAHLPELEGVLPRDLTQLGVIGGGTMGAGIAASALLSGLAVTLTERDRPAADRAAGTVAGILRGAVKRGKITQSRCDAILAEKFTSADSYDALTDADLIIEAVFEKIEVKQQVFSALDRVAKAGAVLATNTSYLDVDRIAEMTSRPQDVIGLHFFSPAHVMRLLEVVAAGKTAPDVVATGFLLARRLGKIGVRAGNCDGFIGNRILTHYRAAADAMVLDGASPYQIDRAVTAFGFAMGPYAVSDLAGLDIGYFTRQRRAPDRHSRDRIPVFADRLYELGRLGRKTGRGYYIHDEDSPGGREDPELADLLTQVRGELGLVEKSFTDDEIVARYMAAMVNEGARVVADGTALRPLDVDVVMLNGYGFPRWRGGPMHWADQYGLASILKDIEGYSREDDHFWQAAPLLRQLVESGRDFADLNRGKTA
ncbi:3-hydroxyacyl-CoA dehydrogenase NAD-binding domain-containing protein [Paracoccus seriniphilus]|uniref:Short chain enoyl-CoA hydratase /3-hydroxyacyl-CoA dehydrogenase n=1 Tax=Paracoccus seriniphilus TaxID=184748 RepID=A0A239PRZ4_9RHOB|nr:3-hydroxyacyl-CoA dehydrogenase NAD-binding domain-containing protein [Paracoccus seriniphilus]WCR14256.1 enoyl-CoA hydratase/isomerase family protein [Paracoccus seriniphilus]SNT73045.1 short chain enoyl-CoA hydratase /3-hydroxyacyl-CoA dehydrogenase [Paracoccus seriniphilus]